uniref:Secreted protein n=1 Tax=Mesocestoides corti TaxID=53468 RepID=A0A5K3FTU3_MESCO
MIPIRWIEFTRLGVHVEEARVKFLLTHTNAISGCSNSAFGTDSPLSHRHVSSFCFSLKCQSHTPTGPPPATTGSTEARFAESCETNNQFASLFCRNQHNPFIKVSRHLHVVQLKYRNPIDFSQ